MNDWTLLYRFYDSLPLAHLERSAFSLSKQTVQPKRCLFYDSNSPFSEAQVKETLGKHLDVSNWTFHLTKDHDPNKTLAHNNNAAIRLIDTDAFILFRADIIHDFSFIEEMLIGYADDPNTFVGCSTVLMPYANGATAETVDHATNLEYLKWREDPKRLLVLTAGNERWRLKHDGRHDCASFMSSKFAMDKIGWYDEALIGWGYDQQSLQSTMGAKGVRMVDIQKPLCFHMMHELTDGKLRDTEKAMEIWRKSPRRIAEILTEEERLKLLRIKNRWYNRLLGRRQTP